ncbi:MAG: YajQ family cyclic di-GMP-binding protein [Oligoflexales bacterium]|nr:YajQ family cyclic di-GMP-binding protein [Oligoflexales bacterium]
MPSMDITSELDLQELDNSVNQAMKEISQRFDFRGSDSSVELDKVAKTVKIVADDDFKLRSIHQVLSSKMAKRGMDPRGLDFGKEESMSGNKLRQVAKVKAGLNKDEAKQITKIIKEMALKVNSQVQDEQVRVSGKSIDDLQTIIAHLKGQNLSFPLQFVNMKRD